MHGAKESKGSATEGGKDSPSSNAKTEGVKPQSAKAGAEKQEAAADAEEEVEQEHEETDASEVEINEKTFKDIERRDREAEAEANLQQAAIDDYRHNADKVAVESKQQVVNERNGYAA